MREESIEKMHEQARRLFGYTLKEHGDYRESWRIFRMMAEFVEGYQFLSSLKNEVTVLGSARLEEGSKYYNMAREFGQIAGKAGYTVITGGGPGIMEAANRGAFEVGAESIGLNIQLPFEQVLNPYVTKSTSFNYFFTRKVMLISPAKAYVFFPGGFGTFDEFFEVVDHMELGLLSKAPIILVGKEFWEPILDYLRNNCVETCSISMQVIDEWHLVDDAQDAVDLIKSGQQEKDLCLVDPENFKSIDNLDWRVFQIMAELVEGFEFVTGMQQGVTMLGSKGVSEDHQMYDDAYTVAHQLGMEGFQVITPGTNQGLPEAMNKGAYEAGGESVGVGLKIGQEDALNPYVTKYSLFKYPFTRKMVITAPTRAIVIFPGGFGTLHHFFEILTLMQTKKMEKIPIILYDRKHWEPLHKYIKSYLVHDIHTISDEDDELYQIVDDRDSVIKVIRDYYSR